MLHLNVIPLFQMQHAVFIFSFESISSPFITDDIAPDQEYLDYDSDDNRATLPVTNLPSNSPSPVLVQKHSESDIDEISPYEMADTVSPPASSTDIQSADYDPLADFNPSAVSDPLADFNPGAASDPLADFNPELASYDDFSPDLEDSEFPGMAITKQSSMSNQILHDIIEEDSTVRDISSDSDQGAMVSTIHLYLIGPLEGNFQHISCPLKP